MPKNLIEELTEQIIQAQELALLKGIKTNAIVLNEDFDFSQEFLAILNNEEIPIKPMILGKHIFVCKLPEDYSFMLTEIMDEEAYQTDLDYYKKRCEELENKIKQIKELL